MDVYDERDPHKDLSGSSSLFRKLKKAWWSAGWRILGDTSRHEIATKITLSGRIENPQTSTAETLSGSSSTPSSYRNSS